MRHRPQGGRRDAIAGRNGERGKSAEVAANVAWNRNGGIAITLPKRFKAARPEPAMAAEKSAESLSVYRIFFRVVHFAYTSLSLISHFNPFSPFPFSFSLSFLRRFYDIGAILARARKTVSVKISRPREIEADTRCRGVDASANVSKLENLGEFTAVKSEYEDDHFPLITGGVDGGRWIVRTRREGRFQPLGTDHWKSWSRKASHGREG